MSATKCWGGGDEEYYKQRDAARKSVAIINDNSNTCPHCGHSRPIENLLSAGSHNLNETSHLRSMADAIAIQFTREQANLSQGVQFNVMSTPGNATDAPMWPNPHQFNPTSCY